jgi:acyl carrier protein
MTMTTTTTTTSSRDEEVLSGVSAMIREVIGEEWAEDVPIAMDTSFAKDLELESIEFVALAEKLKERYGKEVDFAGWLSGMELGQILALRVGQLVELIVRCTSQPQKG